MDSVSLIDPATLALMAGVLLLAGTVKGVVGLGLPTVTLALLTATIGLEAAVAIMLLPSLVTNLWQALAGDGFAVLLRRLWPFLAALAAGTVLASAAPTLIAIPILTMVLGLSIAAYGALGLATPPWSVPPRWERPLSPPMGLATGILTGMTGSFVIPAVPYLQALGLPRDRLVQAMGMTFLVATVSLGVGLGGHGLLPGSLALLSAVAVLPALLGMEMGRRLRGRLSERRFRQALFTALLLLGLWILVKPWI
ncbi:sulfite exporter TauE/SafE family protein [Thalassobaculum sp.]|uniref:sulfite exporter TauE/SafE family protein n=1 Tax=Thalassobaculum sp. TaxID=2022740 RepID=UPI0032ECEEB2